MRVAGSVVVILVLAVLLGLILSPAGDPYSFLVFSVLFMAFGCGSFGLGRFSRASRPNTKIAAAAQTDSQ